MNPGKIVHPPKQDDRSLFRYKPGYATQPLDDRARLERVGRASTGAVEMCNNNGHCRKFDAGTMCPSYPRHAATSSTSRAAAPTRCASRCRASSGAEALADEAMHEALELCVSCKGCRRECPTGVDMARMKIEFLHHYQRAPRLHAARPAGRAPAALRALGLALAPLVNARSACRASRTRCARSRASTRAAPLPAFSASVLARGQPAHAPRGGREVVLFADTFNHWFEPENLARRARVLEAAGYRVSCRRRRDARPLCCGRTYLAAGMVDAAQAEARRMLEALAPWIERGMPVVGLEPSCLFTLRDEFLALLPGDSRASRACRSSRCTFESSSPRACASRRDARRGGEGARAGVLLHGHCHQKAFGTFADDARSCCARFPGRSVTAIESSCCGMAGAFGYERALRRLDGDGRGVAAAGGARGARGARDRRGGHELPPPDRRRRGARGACIPRGPRGRAGAYERAPATPSLRGAARRARLRSRMGDAVPATSRSGRGKLDGRPVRVALSRTASPAAPSARPKSAKLAPLFASPRREKSPLVLYLDSRGRARSRRASSALGAFRRLFREALDGRARRRAASPRCSAATAMAAPACSRTSRAQAAVQPRHPARDVGPGDPRRAAGTNALDEMFRAMAEAAIGAAARAKASDGEHRLVAGRGRGRLAARRRSLPARRPGTALPRAPRGARARASRSARRAPAGGACAARTSSGSSREATRHASATASHRRGHGRGAANDAPCWGWWASTPRRAPSAPGASREAAWQHRRSRAAARSRCSSTANRTRRAWRTRGSCSPSTSSTWASRSPRSRRAAAHVELTILDRAGGGRLRGARRAGHAAWRRVRGRYPGACRARPSRHTRRAAASRLPAFAEYRRAGVADEELKLGIVPVDANEREPLRAVRIALSRGPLGAAPAPRGRARDLLCRGRAGTARDTRRCSPGSGWRPATASPCRWRSRPRRCCCTSRACARASSYLPLNSAYQRGRGRLLPRERRAAARWSRSRARCPGSSRIARATGHRHVFSLDENGAGTLRRCRAIALPARFATVERVGRRPRRDPLHLGNHRPLQGRDDHAPQPRLQRAGAAPRTGASAPDDVLVHMLPLFHVHGLFVACHCVLMNGTAMRFHAKFDARRAHRGLRAPRRCSWACRPSTRACSPSRASTREACARMRLFVSGSAPLLAETHAEFEHRTGHRILERYGMTETGMLTSNPLAGERRPGTVGLALPGHRACASSTTRARRVPPGEIGHVQVRGATCFRATGACPRRTSEEFTAGRLLPHRRRGQPLDRRLPDHRRAARRT